MRAIYSTRSHLRPKPAALIMGLMLLVSAVWVPAAETLSGEFTVCDNMEKVRKLRAAAAACRQKLASGELTVCRVQVTFQNNRLVSSGEAEALAGRLETQACEYAEKIRHQVDSARRAVERQARTIEMGQKELEEWQKRSQEAQRDAILAGVETIFGQLTSDLEAQERSLAAYKGWITQNRNLLARKTSPQQIELALSKLEAAQRAFLEHKLAVTAARPVHAALEAKQLWDLSRATVSAQVQESAQLNQDVQGLLKRPEIGAMFDEIRPNVDRDLILAKSAIETMGPSFVGPRYAPFIGPAANLASFAVSYGYNALAWKESYDRLIQQYRLSDEHLKAAQALKEQLECAENELRHCRECLGK